MDDGGVAWYAIQYGSMVFVVPVNPETKLMNTQGDLYVAIGIGLTAIHGNDLSTDIRAVFTE